MVLTRNVIIQLGDDRRQNLINKLKEVSILHENPLIKLVRINAFVKLALKLIQTIQSPALILMSAQVKISIYLIKF